jgi:dienelactone hydrolase
MKRQVQLIFLEAIGISLMASLPAVAVTSECESKLMFRNGAAEAALVTYYKAFVTPGSDTQCNASGNCDLKGWLYYPKQDSIKGRPAIVFNHGHDQHRGEPCAIANFFTAFGYVVFAPVRRGHTGNGFTNTGKYIDTIASEPPFSHYSLDQGQVYALEDQVQEVREALAYLRMLPMVDPERIALMGHSFGGSLTLFAAAHSLSPMPRAAIDVSGAALEWDDNYWFRHELPNFVLAHKMPIFFLQPSNEISLAPSIVLTPLAAGDGRSKGASGGPVLPYGNECRVSPSPDQCVNGQDRLINHEVHSRFVTDDYYVGIWGPMVRGFLQNNGVSGN